MGLYVVEEVVHAVNLPVKRWYENAHLRKTDRAETDIVVRATPGFSGRFDRCVPIGERRNGAYRVRQDVLNAWGGVSAKDGFIPRSAVSPALNKPNQFLDWLHKQGIQLMQSNN
jgi:hypothetical protein